MKKILFSLIASSAIFYSVNAQTNISFEASEGYNLSQLDGQNGWISLSPLTVVRAGTATHGSNAVYMPTDDNLFEESGYSEAYMDIPEYDKVNISLDYRRNAISGSGDGFAVFGDGFMIADFNIDQFYSDYITVYNPEIEDYVDTNITFAANKWYDLKVTIDKTALKLTYFVDDVKVGEYNLTDAAYVTLDLYNDNYGSATYFDNIEILDATLATSEVSKKDIFRVYPNPTVDVVNFDVAGKINSVEVYDVAGKLVKTAKDGAKSLNVSALSKGSYVVKVQTENGSHTQKLIKK